MRAAERRKRTEIRQWYRAAIAALTTIGLAIPALAAAGPDCALGIYRLADGEVIDIAASGEDTLRWRNLDGETGELKRDRDRWRSTAG